MYDKIKLSVEFCLYPDNDWREMNHYGYQKSAGFGKIALTVFGALLLGLLITAVFGLIAAIPLYFLWNWLMPSIFGLSIISYAQAWGLVWLTSILFKSSSSSRSND